jgi:N-acetylmuramoyl-L-alanine amidase
MQMRSFGPSAGIFILLCVVMLHTFPVREKEQRIVVIDPAGDVKRTGRRIGDSFERGLTLQCAEKIKEMIEERAPHIKVIITRMPGDNVYDLQNATLANRLQADLFISLNFYYTQETKPTLYMYQFSYGNDFACCEQGLALHTYDQAYRINKEKTDCICQRFKKELAQQQYQSIYVVSGPYSLPLKPLIGVIAPTVALDVGLKGKEWWHYYREALANAIIAVVDGLN